MTATSIYLKVKSHPKNLKRIRDTMADITSKTNLSKETVGSIILAVDEACSNIIKHGYQNDYHREIDLTVRLEKNVLVVSIVDNGVRFDIHSAPKRDITKIKQGGLGLYIIQQVMDTVEFSLTPEGSNKLTMKKKLTN